MEGRRPKDSATDFINAKNPVLSFARRRAITGFTIVELLIVVAVIAILAAITIVAYNGITAQARDSSLKADLTNGAKQLHLAKVEDGSFPGSKPSYLSGDIQYSQTDAGQGFCITSSADGRAFHMRQSGNVQDGTCPNHTVVGGGGGGAGGSEIAEDSPIQNVTKAQCQALPTFDGGNSSAIRTVTDSRGGTTRSYEIAKLADGKCWMLTNLKLGSASESITLTPADSDVADNFTLPQLNDGTREVVWSGAGNDNDTPYTYGPLPGDTGSGATNYGYLYNWPAATAGQTASFTTGNAPHSICPAGWRLPSGSNTSSDFAQLDVAFEGTGEGALSGEPNIDRWQYTGPFRGSFSGYWSDGFVGQGDAGFLWSASALPDYSVYAFGAYFGPSSVYPSGGYYFRSNGVGVRCLLN